MLFHYTYGFTKQYRQCTYIVTLRRVRAAIVSVEKQLHNVCEFVALGIQHEMHMRHFVVCGWPALFFHIVS